MSAANTARPSAMKPGHRRVKPRRLGLYAFLVTITFVWLVPFFVAVYEALRSNADTTKNGIFSIAQGLTLDNFIHVLGPNHADLPAGVLQHSGCDDTGGDHRPHRRIDDCLRRFQVQLAP